MEIVGLADGEDLEEKVYEQRDVERDQKKSGDSEFVSASRKNVGSLPIDVFGILDQEIFSDHPIVCRGRYGKLQARIRETAPGHVVSNLGLRVRRNDVGAALSCVLDNSFLFKFRP